MPSLSALRGLVLLSFLSALFSFQASLSFKSYLVRSTPLIRLKASLFRGTPADFRWKSFFRFSMLFLFFSGLSFVPVLSCSFESSHSFEILSLSLCSSPVLFRSTPHIRLQPLSFVGLLLTFVRSNSFVSLCSFFV